ncbi:P-loop NTPase fold protein [Brevibacterium sp. GP-SGM9]|uniref:KAP family P-loop NTPase fold protein n=1 Tax=Brevibacterium sp. GP-SGM9 TaxID=3376990 RepID=UPI0039A42EFD
MQPKQSSGKIFNGPYGYVDLPVDPPHEADRLNVSAYYDGLTAFIAGCQTPMTIAVQGDWGSGKSTTLNFVSSLLPNTVRVIEFNTWLYSQFELGDSLVFSMAHEILRPLSASSDSAKKLMRFVSTMGAGLLKGGADLLGSATGTTALTSAVVESLKNATYSDDAPNVIAKLKQMRDDFETSIEEYCNANHLERVVILIDDLDRVEPTRAIEILESLKLFFEVPRCVFILALDFDVVVRGVGERYGNEFKKKKARQYFDKIIQVPFSMPVAAFKIKEMLNEALAKSGIVDDDPTVFDQYLTIVHESVGTNPRSLKRLLNSFELLQLILSSQGTPLLSAERQLPQIVFALLCAQAAYPELHRQLIEGRSKEDLLDEILSSHGDDSEDEALARDFELEDVELRAFRDFRERLGILSSNQEGHLDVTLLRRGIELSQVTASGPSKSDDTRDDAKSIGAPEVLDTVREKSTEKTAELMSAVANGMNARLRGRELSMFAQEASKTITLYTSSNAEEISNLGPRLRPRFASIGYSRKGLTITFGRSVGDREASSRPFGLEWSDLVKNLEKKFPNSGGPSGAVFHVRESSYPLFLSDISEADGIEEICDVLIKVYDIVKSYRE